MIKKKVTIDWKKEYKRLEIESYNKIELLKSDVLIYKIGIAFFLILFLATILWK
jgi:hypothetical protein